MRRAIEELITREPWELRTTRLDLVPLRREHAAAMFELLRDRALYEFTGGEPPSSIEALARDYELGEDRRSPDGAELWLNWMVRERATGQALGYVQSTLDDSGRADLAWVIGRPWQGLGIATEAMLAVKAWLSLHAVRRFRACILPDHVRSQRVAARLGLSRTAEWVAGEEVWELECP